jgi:hypothetical protein
VKETEIRFDISEQIIPKIHVEDLISQIFGLPLQAKFDSTRRLIQALIYES